VTATLASSAGQQHETFELGLPDLRDAVDMLLKESNVDAIASTRPIVGKAEDIIKRVGRLPFALSYAAACMKQSRTNMGDMLLLLESKPKMQVSSGIMPPCIPSPVLCYIKILSWDLLNYEERSIATTFNTQLDDLDRRSPDAINLLKVLSFRCRMHTPQDDKSRCGSHVVAGSIGWFVLGDFRRSRDILLPSTQDQEEAQEVITYTRVITGAIEVEETA
jgi:hypothetical protein